MVLDIPPAKMEKQFGVIPPSILSEKQREELAAFQFEGDTLKVLAILVEWTARPRTYSAATFDSVLFSRWTFPGFSVADYYEEVSYGRLTMVGDVYGWHNAGTWNVNFDFEPILATLDPVIDYSQYDGNGDGAVDAVVFIRAGNGEEDSQDPTDMWSYAVVYPPGSGAGPYDGKLVGRWNTCPETRPERDPNTSTFLGTDTLNWIRVLCHELGHNLGLPDLYDYDAKLDMSTYDTPGDDNDHPVNDWCIMGYYGYGYMSIGSQIPSHFCGWSKMQLGWIDPVVEYATFGGDHIVIEDIETHSTGSLYRIPIDNTQGEYFLLEYRNPESGAAFDRKDSDFSVLFWPNVLGGADPLDRGLMITHVHDSLAQTWPVNDGTPSLPHYKVAVEDAGYNPAMDVNTNGLPPWDSAQWWYPWEIQKGALFSDDVPGQTVFGPTSFPNSNGYGGPSGITIRVDSIAGDRLYAYVQRAETQLPRIMARLNSDRLCHFNTPPGGVDSTTLTVDNYGDVTLMADVTVTAGGSWLSLAGGASITLEPTDPILNLPVAMNALGLSEGIYEGEIRIDHNDDTQASPQLIRVEFHVNASYVCAERATLRTAATNTGGLSLTVESAGRYASGDQYEGLVRRPDSSRSIFDCSLMITHSIPGPDTVVFYNLYGRVTDPGFWGFVATSPLVLDTGANGTGTGNATVTSTMKTKDGALGIETKWYFPQDPDSADFVLVKHTVTNATLSTISNIAVGQLSDFDVVPGKAFTWLQNAVDNNAGSFPSENLVYQYGRTKSSVVPDPPLELAERYSAGIAYLSGRDYGGSGLPFEQQQVTLRGGTGDFRELSSHYFDGSIDGYFYNALVGPAELKLWQAAHPDSSSDLYMYYCLDQGLTLASGQSETYVIAIVSDTLSHPGMTVKSSTASDLVATVQKAGAWAANHGVFGNCDCACHADPLCDAATDIIDVIRVIEVAFRGGAEIDDAACPAHGVTVAGRTDVDCSGATDVIDVVKMVDVAFRAAAPSTRFCNPCPP
jgi:M6 family metalloprotease-like protein